MTRSLNYRGRWSDLQRLATLLANGVNVVVGERFPCGWEAGSTAWVRRYVIADEESIAAARRLLNSKHTAIRRARRSARLETDILFHPPQRLQSRTPRNRRQSK